MAGSCWPITRLFRRSKRYSIAIEWVHGSFDLDQIRVAGFKLADLTSIDGLVPAAVTFSIQGIAGGDACGSDITSPAHIV
jgi:hypothetical protein